MIQSLPARRTHFTIEALRRHYDGVIGRDRIYRLVRAGHLEHRHINGKIVVPAYEVERFDKLLHSTESVILHDTDGSVILEKVVI